MQNAVMDMRSTDLKSEIAASAARLVVEDGLEYGPAKRQAVHILGLPARTALPDNEDIEDAVFEHIAVFCADTQPAELQALRQVALRWMGRLAEYRPHLSGAVWRGTATRLSAVLIDLYCDDPKAAEITLINAGVDYDSGDLPRPGRDPLIVLTVGDPSRELGELGELVTVHLMLHDADDQRGALKPDARGRSWRGDARALNHLMQETDTP